MASTRTLRLHAEHEHVQTFADTVANVRSNMLVFRPPVGTFYGVPRSIRPVLKLYDSGGTQVPGSTRVFVGKKRPGESSIAWAPGAIDYYAFRDLTTAQQRDVRNAPTLTHDLGATLGFREEDELVLGVEGSTAVDVSQTGTAVEFDVGYQTL